MEERWKPIKGYEGRYEVSSHGRVKSIERISPHNNRHLCETITIGVKQGNGYRTVKLFDCDGKASIVGVHRLVASAFLARPAGYSVVNHLNSNKDDNNVENLEWTTPKGNTQHALNKGRLRSIPIVCIETGQEFGGIRIASRILGIDPGAITKQIKGRLKSIHGLHFRYKW